MANVVDLGDQFAIGFGTEQERARAHTMFDADRFVVVEGEELLAGFSSKEMAAHVATYRLFRPVKSGSRNQR